MSPHVRFAHIIAKSPAQEVRNSRDTSCGDYLLKVGGRTFHLALSPKREEITISTPICVTGADSALVRADLLAKFNGVKLFCGGYRLSVDPLTKSVYVSVTKALDRLESDGLLPFLNDFSLRCASCTRWYANEVFRRAA